MELSYIQASCQLALKNPENSGPLHIHECVSSLSTSNNFESPDLYFNSDKTLTKLGAETITMCFTMGIVGNLVYLQNQFETEESFEEKIEKVIEEIRAFSKSCINIKRIGNF